jgi:hypothetical protein
MFPHGASAYIDDIGKLIPLHDGSIRTALDTGCGVIITCHFSNHLLPFEPPINTRWTSVFMVKIGG